MFRILPHRLLVEPRVTNAEVSTGTEQSIASLHIDGLVCSACAANVRGRLEAVAGVTNAEVDLERSEAAVRYDPARATPKALVDAVEGAVLLRPVRRLLAALGGHRHP